MLGGEFRHLCCAKGMSCYPISFDGNAFVLNSLITSELNMSVVGKKRKPYRQNIVSNAAILEFRNHLDQLCAAVLRHTSEEVTGSVAFLHDIRTSVGIVLSWSGEVIDEGRGTTFEEKLTNAPENLLGLYQSINLLNEQLDLADVITNPARITYGSKSLSSIHGFLYKMFKLWEPRFHLKNRELEIQGRTNARIEAYNSIQFIPLILLDNACKYSAIGRTTFLTLQEHRATNAIEVRVSSYGRVVPPEFYGRIFEKYVRGPNGEELNPHGMGLGLYLAQQIAEAHSFTIQYRATSPDGLTGTNDFFFQMPIRGYEP
jgi:K+-sensing histidine kinase KdpD